VWKHPRGFLASVVEVPVVLLVGMIAAVIRLLPAVGIMVAGREDHAERERQMMPVYADVIRVRRI
jgi:hypothetical protein